MDPGKKIIPRLLGFVLALELGINLVWASDVLLLSELKPAPIPSEMAPVPPPPQVRYHMDGITVRYEGMTLDKAGGYANIRLKNSGGSSHWVDTRWWRHTAYGPAFGQSSLSWDAPTFCSDGRESFHCLYPGQTLLIRIHLSPRDSDRHLRVDIPVFEQKPEDRSVFQDADWLAHVHFYAPPNLYPVVHL